MVYKWGKKLVKPNRLLWTKGNFKSGEGYADWIHVDKDKNILGRTPEERKKMVYNVGAKRRINSQTINGHFITFKNRVTAVKFAKDYVRKHKIKRRKRSK